MTITPSRSFKPAAGTAGSGKEQPLHPETRKGLERLDRQGETICTDPVYVIRNAAGDVLGYRTFNHG